MNKQKKKLNQQLEKGTVKKKKDSNKLNLSTVLKYLRKAYDDDPQGILKVSPELFRIISEEVKIKQEDKHYFENYLTERERADFISQIVSITKQAEIKREEAINILELIAALGVDDEKFKSAFLRACQILELDINTEKDVTRIIQRKEIAYRKEILRGVLFGLDWSGALVEVSLLGKDIKIRNNAESMIGCLSLSGHGLEQKEYKRIPLISKAVVIDLSALLSILNRDDPNHKKISLEFLHLINNRIMVVCHEETLLSLISRISALDGAMMEKICNYIKGCLVVQGYHHVSSSKSAIFKLARGECKGLGNESIHAIYLSKMIGTPLFASNLHVINAFEKIERLLE